MDGARTARNQDLSDAGLRGHSEVIDIVAFNADRGDSQRVNAFVRDVQICRLRGKAFHDRTEIDAGGREDRWRIRFR